MKLLKRIAWYIKRNSFYKFDWLLTVARFLIGYPELFYRLHYINSYKSIKFFNFFDWHHSCCYLTAYKNNVPVFIKIGKNFLINNEITSSEILNSLNNDTVLNVLDSRLSKIKSSYVVFEYLEDHIPLDNIECLTAEIINTIKIQLYNFIDAIEKESIVHRDIKPSNIFVKKDGSSLKVIDFAMSEGPCLQKVEYKFFNNFIHSDMGGNYKLPSGEWNDRYAIDLIIQKLDSSLEV